MGRRRSAVPLTGLGRVGLRLAAPGRDGFRPRLVVAELLERRALLSTGAPAAAAEAPLPFTLPPGTPGTDASVAGRYVFFNHSAFDGNDPAANASDDSALAPGVAAQLPGQSASAANVSGYSRGLNGVMVDIHHLARAGALSADDFVFRTAADAAAQVADPGTWPAAPAPSSITVRPGAGAGGSDRVTLVWPDASIRNAWLQVTVLDTLDTGLPVPDVFAFASLPGEAGATTVPVPGAGASGAGGAAGVDRSDLLATRRGLSRRRVVGADSPFDHNHDGRVSARDLVVVRNNLGSRLESAPAPFRPPTYYVSPAGDDAGDGLGPLSAWRTVARVNSAALPPGAHVLFERGGEWREQLVVPSSGTPEAPVVFGSYGSGLKPRFWGSDPLDNASFEYVTGTTSTYRIVFRAPVIVNSVYANHAFFRSSFMALLKSYDTNLNRDFINRTPGSWFQDQDGVLFVNTAGDDPRDGGTLYTAAVRENVVMSQDRHDVVLRNLVVDECAQWNGGYAFAVGGGERITVEGCEAYRAGRHHFGTIESDDFVGRDLYAAWAMPDLGYGGASAYVSYSSPNVPAPTDSTWVNCAYDEQDPAAAPYLAFYTHGSGMGNVLVQNIVSRGGIGLSMVTEGVNQQVRVVGGSIDDARLAVWGHDVVVDGVTLRGPRSAVVLAGRANLAQNLVVDGARPVPELGVVAAVTDYGTDNTLRFSTIRVAPETAPYAAAVSDGRGSSGFRAYGNVIDAANAAAVRLDPEAVAPLASDHNLFVRDPRFVLAEGSPADLAAWRATGRDGASLVGDPLFADPAAGDLSLRPGSPAVDVFSATAVLAGPPADVLGLPRPQGVAYDLGAFERPAGA